ncbi:hypothetical protein Taro_013042 [Colocasia esculenta]|uniref:Transposase Tnp1/En/Spm-like domain-containing protein n=1 Tax=Colocasia esculenta TaxID=4460 RepID=A0A843UFB5_COLES|nr:hypothetical protein [Colocasia esculenta]
MGRTMAAGEARRCPDLLKLQRLKWLWRLDRAWVWLEEARARQMGHAFGPAGCAMLVCSDRVELIQMQRAVAETCEEEEKLGDVGGLNCVVVQLPQLFPLPTRQEETQGQTTILQNYTTTKLGNTYGKSVTVSGFLTCDWFSRAEFEKFVHDLIIRKIEVQEVVVEVSKKKHRGSTKLNSVYGLDNGKRIVVQINELGQPVGEGGHSLKLFLGTIARLGDKMPIDAPTWRAMSATHKDDVWEYVQRKCDIPSYLKEWVMKDLDQKWRSWKYELRNKYFNPTLKQNEQQIPPNPRVNAEQWARVVQTWSSNSWKRYSDINKKSKSHHKYFHCAGTKSFADINEEETKLQEVKITQPSSSSSSSIASADDIYSQSLMLGKKVKLCDMTGQPVANAIIMSLDKSKMVMGKSLGEEYYEVELDET